jgi:hypothetical protein
LLFPGENIARFAYNEAKFKMIAQQTTQAGFIRQLQIRPAIVSALYINSINIALFTLYWAYFPEINSNGDRYVRPIQ